MSPSRFLFFLTFLFSLVLAEQAAIVLPIQKDHTSRQYTTTILMKTPLQPTKLVVDLGYKFTWMDCHKNYNSTSYQHVFCDTDPQQFSVCNGPLFDFFYAPACGNCFETPNITCANNTCDFFPENMVTRQIDIDVTLLDTIALPTTDGSSQGQLAPIKNYFFACSHTSLLKGLAKGASGVAAMGRSNISLQAQVRNAISAPAYFALCLSGSRFKPGPAFIGSSGPYHFLPGTDVSKSLIYTPLIINPVPTTQILYAIPQSDDYFIGLTAIKVNGKAVPLNKTLLSINDETGVGGTKLSTVIPYTTLQTSIYEAFTDVFLKEASAMNLTRTKPIKPFSFCYAGEGIASTRAGPAVPIVDLVMQSKDVYWRIFGSNSMVRIANKGAAVWCLGFMDGGAEPRTSVVIGGYQMEDNLLQFDLESNRLGFSSSLLLKSTSCANFNFTANKKP